MPHEQSTLKIPTIFGPVAAQVGGGTLALCDRRRKELLLNMDKRGLDL